MKNLILIVSAILFTSSFIFCQNNTNLYWNFTNVDYKVTKQNEDLNLNELPDFYQNVQLNHASFIHSFGNNGVSKKEFHVSLPNPDGAFSDFVLMENKVVSPSVEQFYTVKTYKGYLKERPGVKIRCSISDLGFNAFVFDDKNSFIIEPSHNGNNINHITYYKRDHFVPKISCGHSIHQNQRNNVSLNLRQQTPTELRTYKLAYVSSGEFSQAHGGMPYSTTNVLNTIASGLNMVQPIFERDLGITFILETTPSLVYADPNTDPFDLSNQVTLIEQNHIECVNALGTSGFDIGHLLVWANTGGLASAGVCDNDYKGEGFSGSNFSLSNIFIDYSGHEIGHQFGASHNFVSQECGTSEPGFRFEPGEGSSIMSYAGVCGAPASYQGESDPFFHSASINTIHTFIANSATCFTSSSPGSGNSSAPTANAMSDISIPKETPFILVGDASDGNDLGSITLLWEQNDGNGSDAVGPPNCLSTDQPLFRYKAPSYDNYRVFPDFNEVLDGNNNGVTWEKLPCTPRQINFNLIARDNNSNWGRTGNDQMVVTVENTGPFQVTSPNGNETWSENGTHQVTWNVNGTDAHCSDVDILLSLNNGNTFSVLESSVPNDGSHDVTLPAGMSNSARVLIQCSVGGNFRSASTFFDVSDDNFTIDMAMPVDFSSFDLEKNNKDIVINWTTLNEINCSHFEIEKSRNGVDFDHLQKEFCQSKNERLNRYQVIDKNAFNGINYYRIKQVDLDGTIDYTDTKSINLSKTSALSVYPNPATQSELFITSNENEIQKTITLINQVGKVIKTINTTKNKVDIKSIPNGIYYITVLSEEDFYSQAIVINKP